ncbi:MULTISPECIES: hypothetical protein [Streptomyces]|uniref:hypothetical protein n=1 Tax=Streptomyces TaxID=1883 RepID=UPI0029B599B6|nr:hypothetical protein [Streptomyces sp. NRRL_B-2557]MDX2748331.1 hypothetical protein [Streptomyces sp. NRRL_B-2557]
MTNPPAKMMVESLIELLTPMGETTGSDVNWVAAEEYYGTPLPSDYKLFITKIGSGSIEGQLDVRAPSNHGEPEQSRVTRLAPHALTDPSVNRWSDPDLAQRYSLHQMLLWGEGVQADTLCWLTADPDPDKWPVAVYVRADSAWTIHDCTMSEFLVELLQGNFMHCPLSDLSLMGWPTPRFLHEHDEQALEDQGIYPWN